MSKERLRGAKRPLSLTPRPWGELTSSELDLINKLTDNIEIRTRLNPLMTVGEALIEEVGEILKANGKD